MLTAAMIAMSLNYQLVADLQTEPQVRSEYHSTEVYERYHGDYESKLPPCYYEHACDEDEYEAVPIPYYQEPFMFGERPYHNPTWVEPGHRVQSGSWVPMRTPYRSYNEHRYEMEGWHHRR